MSLPNIWVLGIWVLIIVGQAWGSTVCDYLVLEPLGNDT